MNIFDEIKYLYIQAIGEIPDDSRLARSVEMRNALSNAMAPFCDYRDIARLWNRDRTTIYNAVDKHQAYMMTSKEYQGWYAKAVEVVDAKLGDIPVTKVTLEGSLRQNTHEQIDAIDKAIRLLQEHKFRLERRIRPDKSGTLSDLQEGGVGDDEGHLGDRLVHHVLRDEQLQVQDASRNQARRAHGERPEEGEVVRGTSQEVA